MLGFLSGYADWLNLPVQTLENWDVLDFLQLQGKEAQDFIELVASDDVVRCFALYCLDQLFFHVLLSYRGVLTR